MTGIQSHTNRTVLTTPLAFLKHLLEQLRKPGGKVFAEDRAVDDSAVRAVNEDVVGDAFKGIVDIGTCIGEFTTAHVGPG